MFSVLYNFLMARIMTAFSRNIAGKINCVAVNQTHFAVKLQWKCLDSDVISKLGNVFVASSFVLKLLYYRGV